jgi:hypothetical protein
MVTVDAAPWRAEVMWTQRKLSLLSCTTRREAIILSEQ